MNDHTVPQLPPRSQCTGCAACAEGCPKNAIHMLPDREGFLYPTVTDACIQCGHCTHICPVLRQREAHPEPAVFAAWNPDNAVRQNSTCGGVFSLLADYVLEGGGVVFGAGMDAQLRVRHEAVKRKEDLPRIRGAKPVQSDVTGIYQQVRQELDRGRPVLFSGTPCQVDGLYHYLGEHPEKLLTCDVLCRGVCSPGVWAKLVQSMAYIKRKQPVAVQFCGGSAASRYGSTTALPSTPLCPSPSSAGAFSETSSCARPVTPVPMPPWTGPAICRWEHSAACLRTPTPRSSAAVSPCCW